MTHTAQVHEKHDTVLGLLGTLGTYLWGEPKRAVSVGPLEACSASQMYQPTEHAAASDDQPAVQTLSTVVTFCPLVALSEEQHAKAGTRGSALSVFQALWIS